MARTSFYETRARELGITLPTTLNRLEALSNLAKQLHPDDYKVYNFLDTVLNMVPNLPTPRHGRLSRHLRPALTPASISELVFERQVAFRKLRRETQDLSQFGKSQVALLENLEYQWVQISRCHQIELELMTTLELYFGVERHRSHFYNIRFAVTRVCHRRLKIAAKAVKENPWLKIYLSCFLANVVKLVKDSNAENGAATLTSHQHSSASDGDGDDDCPICSIGLFQAPEDSELVSPTTRPEIISCPQCRQCMHVSCLETWIEKQEGDDATCPLCRAVFSDRFQDGLLDLMADQLEVECRQLCRLIEI
ncbi:hypothetical protein PV10_00338 [Exophiala mesophila]|uniref:RING-type domain-containing protein n=1 Tax=Exophiala mesophila TaxID=212818 RepID=A0A0D2AC27_EXOME|nr:uncharacterized protein PV10_00338 [Exophiala mesophila]KIV96468.1 hypothetical protein PV10_00338 [Exophiala mesophila]